MRNAETPEAVAASDRADHLIGTPEYLPSRVLMARGVKRYKEFLPDGVLATIASEFGEIVVKMSIDVDVTRRPRVLAIIAGHVAEHTCQHDWRATITEEDFHATDTFANRYAVVLMPGIYR